MVVILGIETSCDTGLVFAGCESGAGTAAVAAERRFGRAARFEIALFDAVREALAAAGTHRPDGIAVGLGPGSYTGLRIGLAAAKGMALGWGTPVVGLASDRTLLAALPAGTDRAVVVWPDRRGYVTSARFERSEGWTALEEYSTRTPEEAAVGLDASWALAGPGAAMVAACGAGLAVALRVLEPSALVLLNLALAAFRSRGPDDLDRLAPRYLRPLAPVYQAPAPPRFADDAAQHPRTR